MHNFSRVYKAIIFTLSVFNIGAQSQIHKNPKLT